MVHLLWISLLPFLTVPTSLGRLVFINGVLAHGIQSRHFVLWDIACNICLGVYVALTAVWQPATNVCILFALIVWQYNRNRHNRPLLHLCGVQMPLLVAATYY